MLKESGGKCANPGCPSKIVDLHHINEWHIYQIHDAKDMIAICPTCHAHVHRKGLLSLDDNTLRHWKGLQRVKNAAAVAATLYIEPGQETSVILGTLRFITPNSQLILLQLSNCAHLSFRVNGNRITLVNLRILAPDGRELVRMEESSVRCANEDEIKCDFRPGRICVTVPATTNYIESTALHECQDLTLGLIKDDRLTIMDIEVIDIATVKVIGVWAEGDKGVIASKDWLLFRRPGMHGFFRAAGYNKERGDLFGLLPVTSNLPQIRYQGVINYPVLENFLSSQQRS